MTNMIKSLTKIETDAISGGIGLNFDANFARDLRLHVLAMAVFYFPYIMAETAIAAPIRAGNMPDIDWNMFMGNIVSTAVFVGAQAIGFAAGRAVFPQRMENPVLNMV